jgi:hypothetical protein
MTDTERRIAGFVDRYTPAVAALIAQAIETRRDAPAAAAPLSTVIKAEVEKQRPRHPATQG